MHVVKGLEGAATLAMRSLLIWMTVASPVTAQSSPIVVAEDAVAAILRHLQEKGKISVAWDSFQDRELLLAAANELGIPVGPRAELKECTEDRKSCWITTGTKRLVTFHGGFTGSDTLLTTDVIISTQVDVGRYGGPMLFASVRRLTVARTPDGWKVIEDELHWVA